MRFTLDSSYRSTLFLLISACLLTPAFAQTPISDSTKGAASNPMRALITQAIDETHLVTLRGTVLPQARPEADLGVAPDSLPLGRTMLMLNNTPAQQASLIKFLNEQQNPKSANYHKWLQPEEFGSRFGAAPEDIETITQWLERYGFSVEAPMPAHNLIIFSGTEGQLKAAFHTELHNYKAGTETYWANATDPQVPAALSGVIRGFASLNNFPRKAQHTAPQLIRHDKASWKPASGSTMLQPQFTTTDQGEIFHVIGPADLATIYNIQPLLNSGINGADQTIAIVSDSDINPADVDYFRATFGLPAKKLNIIYYGNNPGPTANEGEADLDVQWSGAAATEATIDLVVAADGATSGGVDGAAVYAINNNLASILNVSYAVCEFGIGTAGNAFYAQAWEQAAAQGIMVTVAAGDAGSAVCDSHEQFAEYGLSVNAIASTPYNVAVGGTDFYASGIAPDTYWNSTNDALTLASAKSYIPETPWNDSCASPEVFAALQAIGVADATPEAVCNDPLQTAFLTTAGGSGGASNCSIGTATQCISGYAKPAWQSGVAGIPSDGVRDLPDVSLMAGNGVWGSFYVYCQSDAAPGGVCDVNNAIQGAGGTSFASPIFAGIMALVQQKTNSQQGNVNYVLYKLAAAQNKAGANSMCQTANAASGNSCKFYDVTQGTIAVPCYTGSSDCKPSVAADTYGILPGYDAAVGYDLASGLGSLNAFNVVEGWTSASSTFLPTTSTVSAAQGTAIYGAPFAVSVAVSAIAPATGTPSGDVGITSNSATANSISVADTTLAAGAGAVTIALLPTGTYQLFARYAGDATFAPSVSKGVSVTVTPGVASLSLISTRSNIQPGQKVTLSVTLSGASYGAAPTGKVVFTDATSGAVFGSEAVSAGASDVIAPSSIAYVTIPSTVLQSGVNSIAASYSGDSNYQATTAVSINLALGEPFVTSIAPGSVTVAANGSGTANIIATPSGSYTLDASTLTFSCPATMPAGLTCSFSMPVAGSGGSVTSTLTLQAVSPLYVKATTSAANGYRRGKWLGLGTVTSSAGLILFGIARRRRRFDQALAMLIIVLLSSVLGCGGSGSTVKMPALIATSTALSVSSATPSFNSPVTLTATVTPSSSSISPTGTVSFSSASALVGTAPLSSGSATLVSSGFSIGAQAVVASYSGDSTYAKSQSASTSLDVVYSTTIAITGTDKAGDTSSSNLLVTIQ